ncbi:hypothetical protein [Marinomonas transparens]|uniref:Uncharacterized protein n=1 Tax=Marinomonas transparens TaxID=2795388 RepID=A0A934JXQ1_9GAMM|nr:hypothetical protein [Marinomonas transparens]MBJ7539180.1 hypothetical protein [Marinomonas transparens]
MFILRSFIYLFLVAGVAQLISLEGYRVMTSAQYNEHSVTEHLQDIFTFFSSLLFLYAAKLDARLRVASTLLSALLAMMFIRESDSLLDLYLFDGAWQTLISFIFLTILVFLWGQFSSIYASMKLYSEQACFGTFLAGMVTLLAFSRLMGRGSFWEAVMGSGYIHTVKNIVEEGIETLGYTLIFISAVELVVLCISQKRQLTSIIQD